MFTVKAELDPMDGSGVRNVSLFAADHIKVNRYLGGCEGGKWEVDLYDAKGSLVASLFVGSGPELYCGVFIMNAAGKTVERVISAS